MVVVNLSLLAFGGLLVAVPIALHLLMRQQPKHVVFPALRFVRQRREANRRRLRLRHWLLLMLRCAVICVLAAALARPSVASAAVGDWVVIAVLATLALLVGCLTCLALVRRKSRMLVGGFGSATLILVVLIALLVPRAMRKAGTGLLAGPRAPVAAVLVFDTSSRMQYVHQNKTRLAEAQQSGQWLLRQLPADSDVAVLDSRVGPAAFAIDRGAAARAVEALQVTHVPAPLVRVMENALRLVDQSEKVRKEIYVFTDMTRAAWDASTTRRLRSTIEQARDTLVYLWDVGVESPSNFWLGPPRISASTLAKNSVLNVQIELMHTGPGGERTVELYTERPDEELPIIVDGKPVLPQPQLRSRETLQVEANGSRWASFSLRGLDLGTHHGYVKIVGQDGLSVDDVRYFTVKVTSAWPILVVTGTGAKSSFLTNALAPAGFRETGRARFRCDVIDVQDLATADLSGYEAVCLLDPPPLSDFDWQRLEAHVRDGAGLGVFLGRNVFSAEEFNKPSAQAILPGTIARVWRAVDDLYLAPQSLEHPMLAPFRALGSTVPWDGSPVYRHWTFRELRPDSTIVLRFGNDQPAIVESHIGDGRVLTMTTPISDPLHTPRREPWNQLLSSLESWPAFLLCNEALMYLVRDSDTRLNYLVGQTARLRLPATQKSRRVQLFTPRGDWREVTIEGGELNYRFTETPGAYRMKGGLSAAVANGFSANLPVEASQLDRLTPETLDGILGPDRYRVARSQNDIDRGIGEARRGREFYPVLLLLLVIILGFEITLANAFYRDKQTTQSPTANTRWSVRAEAPRARSA